MTYCLNQDLLDFRINRIKTNYLKGYPENPLIRQIRIQTINPEHP